MSITKNGQAPTRDELAAMFMQATLIRDGGDAKKARSIAKVAFIFADAFLEEATAARE
jgi:hypothetical protein